MGKKILLADDSITIQKVIELTFSDEDFDVVTVGNGRLALERLAEVRPDIVLCDIIMPEKDGYEVCEQIKKSAAFSHVPVLLLTGAFEPFDQERAARAGYDGSLAKPFEPETLIAKVRDLLARAPQRAAAPTAPPTAPPVVPFARPSAALVPPAFVPPSPPPTPPAAARPAAAPAAPSYIPDEPFDSGSEVEPEPVRGTSAALAPMSDEESATLLSAPPEEAEPESTSTVMFKASELPWNVAAPATAPVTQASTPVPVPIEPAFVQESETVFEPDEVDSAEVVEEATVFEEVMEEDLDFEVARTAPVDELDSADTRGATVMFSAATTTMPPASPPVPAEPSATTASFGAMEETNFPELEPAPLPDPEPEPQPARPRTPASMAAAWSTAPPPPSPPPAAPPRFEPSPQSFADVASSVEETTMPPASEAAAVSVPVEMVEKIAQRVVAQISEKAVREIAWEVIPDLAEALIKQEIERLKAELQKL